MRPIASFGVMPRPPAEFSPFTIAKSTANSCLSFGSRSSTARRPGSPITSPRKRMRMTCSSGAEANAFMDWLFRDDLDRNQVYAHGMFHQSIMLQGAALLFATSMAHVSAQLPPPSAPDARPKISPLADAPDWSKLQAFDGVLTREEFEQALRDVYTNGSSSPVPWRVEAEAVFVE